MFRKMPFILLAIILCAGWMGQWLPPFYQSILYAISLSIKAVIVFILPFVVFGLLFKTAVHLANKASKMILFILAAVCCSNFLSTLLSYSVGTFAYRFDLSMSFPQEGAALLPAWNFSFPKWIENDQAMFSGLLLGVFLGWLRPLWAKQVAFKLEKAINYLLKGILFVIPFFIAGFIVKMSHDQVMGYIFRNYALIFALIGSSVFAYIVLIYFVSNHCRGQACFQSLKNMLPAAMTGFGSMSSAAAMPLTILGTEKNAKSPDLARSIIPATVNIHLIGDCFAIPIFAFAVMKSFGSAEPAFSSYLIFAAYFVLAKFSVAAVPGGGILVMLPILEAYLGFNAEMLSLITALYILFDPVITCANILGNGGFALALENVSVFLSRSKTSHLGNLQESRPFES
ncbi:cation:dicarboxylate symporter family transporter [Candidatus Protochlamydia phocaeensis]|uniref:cation:dicarboxylate symporter family transporter n=1 Tax=Candidatus Protochlamydia phocaeensis TaxID=1414722 RepID=UPI000837D84D|nr:cation:dicarboxylase symporter family transporter [Candidatus Protochlamydia phocaeensis]